MTDLEPTPTDVVTRKFSDGLVVRAEIVNVMERFLWRLCCGELKSEWTNHYSGIATLQVGKRQFAYATDYWSPMIPTEEPFEIEAGEPI